MLIICDIDGTLAYSDTEVSYQMLDAINDLQEKNEFIIMGNGSYNHIYNQFIKKYLKWNDKDLYVYALGGLECYKVTNEGEMKLYSNELSSEEKYKIVNVVSSYIHDNNLYPDTYDQIEDRGSMIVFSIMGRKANKELKKNFDPDKKIRKQIVKDLQPLLSEFELNIGGTTTIDITKKGYNKGFGIKKVHEMFNCEYDDMIYFGDDLQEGGNDYAVKEFVHTVEVNSPKDTIKILKEL